MIRNRYLWLAIFVSAVFGASHIDPVPMSYDFGGHLSRVWILMNKGFGWTEAWYNGYHLFHYYPPLYYILTAPAAFLSFDLMRPFSFAVFGFTAFTSMFYYSRRNLSGNRAAASGLFFLTGWMLYIVHISGSMPQALAAALTPLFYLKLLDALEGENTVPVAVLGAALVLLHHNAAVVAALGAAITVALNYRKDIQNVVSAGLLATGLTSFWLLPALMEFSVSSYRNFPRAASRGIESVLWPPVFFLLPLGIKVLTSLDSIRENPLEASIGFIGILFSLGSSTVFLSSLPVLSRLPPYRFYLLGAFAFSYLAAASRLKILLPALTAVLLLSVPALTFDDDGGFEKGQLQAYRYLAGEDVDLLYDSEDTDLRAYAVSIHHKDIANGWSVGSTSLRPGLRKLENWEENGSGKAAEFLRNWSVDYALTYRGEEGSMGPILSDSSYYTQERCFRDTCIYRITDPLDRVERKGKRMYRVDASRPLPIPYSNHFNGSSSSTKNGFLRIEGSRRKLIRYRSRPVHELGLLVSLLSALFSVLLYRRRSERAFIHKN